MDGIAGRSTAEAWLTNLSAAVLVVENSDDANLSAALAGLDGGGGCAERRSRDGGQTRTGARLIPLRG